MKDRGNISGELVITTPAQAALLPIPITVRTVVSCGLVIVPLTTLNMASLSGISMQEHRILRQMEVFGGELVRLTKLTEAWS
jgi:hypothetical protein